MKRNIWTNVSTSAVSAAASLLLTGGLVLAATEASNDTTGAGSTNTAESSVSNSTSVNQTNNASISNNLSIYANTGKNEANKNTGDASITTGDINGSVAINNNANSNSISGSDLFCCDIETSASNTKTGADSYNKADSRVDNNFDLDLVNNAKVSNNLDADLNTGKNEANKNTGSARINTGDINFDVSINNSVNNNSVDTDPTGGPNPPGNQPNPGVSPTATVPTSPRLGEVLAAAGGLPVTGGNPLTLPLLVVAMGFALKMLEKYFKVKFDLA